MVWAVTACSSANQGTRSTATNYIRTVSESTKLDLDSPTTLRTPRDPSRSSSESPTRTGWSSKSVTSSPAPVQRSLLDQPVPLSPASSLRVVEAPSTSSSAGHGPATSTVNNTSSVYTPNIPLLGRSNMMALVVVEDLGTSLCSVFIHATNITLKR